MEDSPIHQRASKIRFRPAISWYLPASTALQWQQNCAHQTSEYFLPHLCCWITQFSQPRGAASPAILSETVAVDTTFSEKKRPSFIFVASDFLRYSKMVVHLYSDVSKYSWDRLKTYCIGFRNTKTPLTNILALHSKCQLMEKFSWTCGNQRKDSMSMVLLIKLHCLRYDQPTRAGSRILMTDMSNVPWQHDSSGSTIADYIPLRSLKW